ncbi:unnamed protein product [Echinostoma caproni]|uniref:Transcription initiation factor TFIID subunit 4 n=1 Tax=Echinostoma caproni TaxID=27848 RepID=A0A183B2V8_9TREM|nr:unnamed protein product [Echinostoma caproni]
MLQLGPATRVLVSTQPSTHTIIAGDSTVRPLGLAATTVARPTAVPVDHGLTRVHLQPQPVMTIQQPQRMPQQTLAPNTLVATAPGVVSANATGGTHIQQPQLQAHRGVITAGIQPGTAPQLAALPSGLTGDQTHRDQISGGTPMIMSGPPTPMTPASVASRTPAADGSTPGWQRPRPGQAPSGSSATTAQAGRKRRHRSPYQVGDTDTEVDDDYDEDGEDIGDEVELMTNATMTPAGQV